MRFVYDFSEIIGVLLIIIKILSNGKVSSATPLSRDWQQEGGSEH
jgi:hypothetical protein